MNKWFYLNNNDEPVGPHTAASLIALAKAKVITEATYVTAEGFAEWRTWDQVRIIVRTEALPPLPPTVQAPPVSASTPEPAAGPAAEQQTGSSSLTGQVPGTPALSSSSEASLAADGEPVRATSAMPRITDPQTAAITPPKRERIRVQVPLRRDTGSGFEEQAKVVAESTPLASPLPDLLPEAEMYAKGGVAIWVALSMLGFILSVAQLAVGAAGALFCLALFFAVYAFFILRQVNAPRKWLTPASQTPEENRLYAFLQELSAHADLPLPKIALVQDPELNAFTTGLSRNSAKIVVTEAFMRHVKPTDGELKAILAHELSHIAHGDVVPSALLRFPIWVLEKARNFLGYIRSFGVGFLQGIFQGLGEGGGCSLIGLAIIIGVIFGLLYLSIAMLEITVLSLICIFFVFAFEREREYLADLYAARLLGTAGPMQSALAKLEQAQQRVQAKLEERLRKAKEVEQIDLEVPAPETPPDAGKFIGEALSAKPGELHSGFRGEFLLDHPLTKNRIYYLQHPHERKQILSRWLRRLEEIASRTWKYTGAPEGTVAKTLFLGAALGALAAWSPAVHRWLPHRHQWLFFALPVIGIILAAFALRFFASQDRWSGKTYVRRMFVASYVAATTLGLVGPVFASPYSDLSPVLLLLAFGVFFVAGTKLKSAGQEAAAPTEPPSQPI